MTTTYQATAARDGRWWSVEIPDQDGLPNALFTQGRNLKDAEAMARDAIALVLDIPVDDVAVHLVPQLPEAAQRAIGEAEEHRAERDAEEAARLASLGQAARALVDNGWTVRDAASALGLSYQRIAQLAPRRTA